MVKGIAENLGQVKGFYGLTRTRGQALKVHQATGVAGNKAVRSGGPDMGQF